MAKKKDDIFDIDAIKKQFSAALQTVAEDVGYQIQIVFDRAIQNFYDSYDPNWYDRTGAMFQLSSGSEFGLAQPLWKQLDKDGLCYEVGITVGPDNVAGNPYKKNPHHGLKVTPDFVHNISYKRGIHGFNRADLTFKRDERTGTLLRRDRRNKNIVEVRRKDKWVPGFSGYGKNSALFSDIFNPFTSEYEGVGGSANMRSVYNDMMQQRAREFNVYAHVPTNAPEAPELEFKRNFKEVCKSINLKLNKAMGFI